MELTRQAILEADDQVIEPMDVPEWGGTIYVRSLTAQERDSYDRAMVRVGPRGEAQTSNALNNVRALLLVRCVTDKGGTRLFGDKDATALGKKSSAVVQRVWAVAQRLSGMDAEEQEAIAEDFVEAQPDDDSSA